ncbi:unnamed protein product, partial [Symbiodinium necroappetens]
DLLLRDDIRTILSLFLYATGSAQIRLVKAILLLTANSPGTQSRHIMQLRHAAAATKACPHESTMLEERKAQVDFDREGNGSGACQKVRWISLADRGAAHLVLQLEGAAQAPEADEGGGLVQPLPRLNSISWHPELAFLDDW